MGLAAATLVIAPGATAPASAAVVSPRVGVAAAVSTPVVSTERRATLMRAAASRAEALGDELKLGVREELVVRDVVADADGMLNLRYDRTYAGLPVLGGDMVVHQEKSGEISSVDLASSHPIELSTVTPQIDKDSALADAKTWAAKQKVKVDGATARLVVWAGSAGAGAPVLAWESTVAGVGAGNGPNELHRVTDARTGAALSDWDAVDYATGHGYYDGTVPVETTRSGSVFQLVDSTRGNFGVYNLGNQDLRLDRPATAMTDSDDVWGDGTLGDPESTGVDVAYAMAKTWDFYQWLGRNGARGDGTFPSAVVHVGKAWRNANYEDDRYQVNFGDGRDDAHPWTGLEVVGHEVTHSVTAATAKLNKQGESGALNEATSDILGTAVKFYAHNDKAPFTYHLNAGADNQGDGTAFRYMDHPSRIVSSDGRSADYWSNGVGSLDPHLSSGVGDHFFYLLAEGSGTKTINGMLHESPTFDGKPVTGIGIDAAIRIWYRALTTYFTSTTGYANARGGTLKAAADLFGANSLEYAAVARAWAAVNVTADDAVPATVDGENDTDLTVPESGDAVESPIVITKSGKASAATKVSTKIVRTQHSGLTIDLVAPSGTVYPLRGTWFRDERDDLVKVYVVDASAEPAAGTWTLRVQDQYAGNTGYLDYWSIAL